MSHSGSDAEPEPQFSSQALPDRANYGPAEMVARAQTFLGQMKTRHTVRDYAPDPVPQAVIEAAVATAGTAPSGANQQPWHFVAISNPEIKARIRAAAEIEERKFYDGGGGAEWLSTLAPLGTDADKPHLEDAAWLIVCFAQRYGVAEDGSRIKHYYVPESTGIACGFLIAALHLAGLATLTHTPNPMKFLSEICGRPEAEKPIMIVAAGHAARGATVPEVAKVKKPLTEILTVMG